MKNVDPPLYSPLDSKNSCVILERERERVRKSFCDDYSVENKKKKKDLCWLTGLQIMSAMMVVLSILVSEY